METWSRLRNYIFPVEIFFFLYVFVIIFQTFFYQQYYFQSLAQNKLSSLPNYTSTDKQQCLAQDYIVNYTGNASFVALQEEVNRLNMYSNIVSIGGSFVSAVVLGSLSDRLGRRPVAGIAILGMMISSVVQTLLVYFNWNTYYFLLVLGIHGMTGGFPLICGMAFATVADTTTAKWLGIRMGVLESCIAFARAVGSLGTNNWIHSTRCSFVDPSLLCLGVTVGALIYLLFMPETAPYKSQDKYLEVTKGTIDASLLTNQQSESGLKKVFNGLQIYFNPSYVGFTNWWRIWLATATICLACSCSIGGTEITNFFLHNKPLEWTYDKIGYYGAAYSSFMGLVLVVVVPALVFVRCPYPMISMVGVVCGTIGCVVVALVRTDWEMYVGGMFLAVQTVTYPAMRTLLERYVQMKDRGAVFTISSSFQMLTTVVASIVFNEVYRPEAEVHGHMISASTVFWIMVGIWASCIPLLLCLQCIREKNQPMCSAMETTPLLQNTSDSSSVDIQ